jgi:hypothetical protein
MLQVPFAHPKKDNAAPGGIVFNPSTRYQSRI